MSIIEITLEVVYLAGGTKYNYLPGSLLLSLKFVDIQVSIRGFLCVELS